uniref:Uncharacterized protein n=1 Tax=Plectus sambesii TaxID=2011161 RepID=A0A914X7T5_9BILA
MNGSGVTVAITQRGGRRSRLGSNQRESVRHGEAIRTVMMMIRFSTRRHTGTPQPLPTSWPVHLPPRHRGRRRRRAEEKRSTPHSDASHNPTNHSPLHGDGGAPTDWALFCPFSADSGRVH